MASLCGRCTSMLAHTLGHLEFALLHCKQRQADDTGRADQCARSLVRQCAVFCHHQRLGGSACHQCREGGFLSREGCWNVLLCSMGPCPGKAVSVCVSVCLIVRVSVVHYKRATGMYSSALWASSLGIRVGLWVRVRVCVSVSVSVMSRTLCLMVFVSASRCSPHCCGLAGMRGDSVHFSTVRYLHCHCLLVLLVSKRCRSAVCFAASAVPS